MSPGAIDPVRDIETITTELVLADLEAVQKRLERGAKDAKRGDKTAVAEARGLKETRDPLQCRQTRHDPGTDARREGPCQRSFYLLTDKPTIFAANVKETDLAGADANPFVQQVREYAREHHACETVVISAQIESDLIDLSPDEAQAFLKELGVEESGRRRADPAAPIICWDCGHTLRLAKRKCGPGPSMPATPRRKRPGSSTAISNAASSRPRPWPTRIWSDAGRWRRAREKGFIEWKGKSIVVQDGDVMLFKFNV